MSNYTFKIGNKNPDEIHARFEINPDDGDLEIFLNDEMIAYIKNSLVLNVCEFSVEENIDTHTFTLDKGNLGLE